MNTEMPLLQIDIDRIIKLKFNRDYFISKDNGWLQLRNYKGMCIFNDGIKCLIYENRPEGCKMYPIIYDETSKRVKLDPDCPQKDRFIITENDEKNVKVIVKMLREERKNRM